MNIKLWKGITSFTKIDDYPSLPCPYCREVNLELDKSEIQLKPVSKELLTRESRIYQNENEIKQFKQIKADETIQKMDGFWLPLLLTITANYSDYVDPINGETNFFNGFFNCSKCKNSASVSGVLLKANQGINDKKIPCEMIKIEHISPTIQIFPISENVPKNISRELMDSFKHFHFDPLSSASKLRRAIEQFCDDQKIEGTNLNRKVQNLAKSYPEEAAYLEPLKLIGNEGTHGTNVNELDLLYAFQMFQFVLELYDRKARFIELQNAYEALAEKVGRNKLQLEHKQLN